MLFMIDYETRTIMEVDKELNIIRQDVFDTPLYDEYVEWLENNGTPIIKELLQGENNGK